MNTWAVLAAKEATIASGLGTGIVPVVGAGSLDGFALGALMSGTCILMLTSPRRKRRRSLAAAAGGQGQAAARGPAPQTARDEPGVAVPEQAPDETGSATGGSHDLAGGGYQSRHRLSDEGAISRPPAGRRSAPRHAVPPASFSTRMTGRLAVRALASAVRS